MEAKRTKELIDSAIKAEIEHAKQNWGPTYASEHEAYAVLKEEVEEAADDLELLQEDLELLWNSTKGNAQEVCRVNRSHIAKLALALAIEAVQIAAVANKAGV